MADKDAAAITAGFDSSDKDALVSAGFDTKYIDKFLLPQITANRGIQDGKPFYKDSSGAETTRDKAISNLVDTHPELVTVNRALGNNTANGPGTTTTNKDAFNTLLGKSQEGKLTHAESLQLSTMANEMKTESLKGA